MAGKKKKLSVDIQLTFVYLHDFFKFSGIGMNLNWDAGDRNFLQEEAAHVSVEI